MRYKATPPVKINDKDAIVDEIYIAPLGHLMVKLYFPDKKVWTTYNIGEWKNIILPHIKEKEIEKWTV